MDLRPSPDIWHHRAEFRGWRGTGTSILGKATSLSRRSEDMFRVYNITPVIRRLVTTCRQGPINEVMLEGVATTKEAREVIYAILRDSLGGELTVLIYKLWIIKRD